MHRNSVQEPPVSAGNWRVGIVDDSIPYARRLADAFNATPGWRCIGICADAEEAFRQLPGAKPDVVFLDVKLPGVSGDHAVSRIGTLLPQCSIVMLTVVEDPDALFRSIQSGALGYILKGATWAEILEAAESAVQGGASITPMIATRLLERLKQFPLVATTPVLTPAELDALKGCAQGETDREIAKRLGKSPYTVRAQFRNILEKLDCRSRAQAVGVAVRRRWL